MGSFFLYLLLIVTLYSQGAYQLEKGKEISASEIHERYHSEFWNGDVSAFDISKSLEVATLSDSLLQNRSLLSDSSIIWYKADSIHLLQQRDSIYWLRFSVYNKLKRDFSALFFFNSWKKIQLFRLDSNNTILDERISGNYLSLSERDVENRRIPFIQENLHRGERSSFLVRLEKGGDEFWLDDSNDKLSVLIYNESDILNAESTIRLILGFSVGLVATMILFNFLLFVLTRNFAALYNGLFLFFWQCFYITVYGIAFEYFWPNAVFWDFHAHSFFIAPCIASISQFFRYSLDLKHSNRNYDRFFNIISLSTILIIITQLLDLRDWNELFINLLFTASFFAGVLINYKLWKSGREEAKYYFIGIVYMHVIQIFIGLSQNGVFPYFYGAITNFDLAQYAGSVMVALYSYGIVLAYKSSLDEINKEAYKRSLAEIQAESYKELEEKKSRFFSTISHEFRTPLTLILGHSNTLLKEGKENSKLRSSIESISKNSKRLLRLINQLLDFSKVEGKAMPVIRYKSNLVSFSKLILSNFKSAAKEKGIKLKLLTDLDELVCDLDFPKMEKVLLNLVSNAIKFTQAGFIHLRLKHCNGKIQIELEDSGIGIPEKELKYVFDRFYQVQQENHREYEGSGIGLALCKELVELHQGHITVSSELGKGTTFYIDLPYQNQEECESFDFKDSRLKAELELSAMDIDKEEPSATCEREKHEKSILIVEDHKEMRSFIRDSLGGRYHIIEAHNGKKGLDQAKKFIPDIILTDIMMPQMDGIRFIQELANCFDTRHIPVIILSGKADKEGQLEGLSCGAIDYLIKPFEKEQLDLKVKSVLKQFEHYKERLEKIHSVDATKQGIENADEQFLLDLAYFVKAELKDINSAQLCEKVALSESSLFRKLKALTGKGINSFIRKIRLNSSLELVEHSNKTISEIAYQCGFSSASHFSKAFKEEFSYLPSKKRIILEND